MTSRTIDIQSTDGQTFKGYLALPPTGSGPGIVLIQEIFGVNAHIRAVADQYASAGYVVLAPDVFWRQEPGVQLGYDEADMKKGIGLMQQMDFSKAVQDLAATVEALRRMPECNGKVGTVGYCMGGLLSYLCAAHAGVDAAVCYYPGGIQNHLTLADKITCPIVFHFPEKDKHITADVVEAVRKAFDGRKNVAIEVYADVDHGFNCWARGAYHQKTAAVALGLTLSFLGTAL